MSPLIAFLEERLGAARQLLRRLSEAEDNLEWDGGHRLVAFPYGGETLPLSGLVWVIEPWAAEGDVARSWRDEAAPESAGGLVGWFARRFGSTRG